MLLIPVTAVVVRVVAVVAAVEEVFDIVAVDDSSLADSSGVQGTVLVVACS